MIVDFSIAPIGKGESLSVYVAEVFRIIEEPVRQTNLPL